MPLDARRARSGDRRPAAPLSRRGPQRQAAAPHARLSAPEAVWGDQHPRGRSIPAHPYPSSSRFRRAKQGASRQLPPTPSDPAPDLSRRIGSEAAPSSSCRSRRQRQGARSLSSLPCAAWGVSGVNLKQALKSPASLARSPRSVLRPAGAKEWRGPTRHRSGAAKADQVAQDLRHAAPCLLVVARHCRPRNRRRRKERRPS